MGYMRYKRNVYELVSPAGRWLGTAESMESAKKIAERKLQKKPHLKQIEIIKPIGFVIKTRR